MAMEMERCMPGLLAAYMEEGKKEWKGSLHYDDRTQSTVSETEFTDESDCLVEIGVDSPFLRDRVEREAVHAGFQLMVESDPDETDFLLHHTTEHSSPSRARAPTSKTEEHIRQECDREDSASDTEVSGNDENSLCKEDSQLKLHKDSCISSSYKVHYPKQMPSPSESFDVVCLTFVAARVSPKAATEVFREALRILQEGGLLYVLDIAEEGSTVEKSPEMRTFLSIVDNPSEFAVHDGHTQNILASSGYSSIFNNMMAQDDGRKPLSIVRWFGVKR